MRTQDAVGRYGEDVAAAHLAAAGLVVVERNWRCPDGEIDVVARDGDVLVFCEVKTRRGVGFGLPAEAVTPAKVRRLRLLARRWMEQRRPPYGDVRFDVISVLVRPGGGVVVDHLPAAF